MKSLFSSCIIAVSFAALANANPFEKRAPACVADNCLRALTITDSNMMASRPVIALSDCSKWMQPTTTLTFTPTVSTVYATATSDTSTTYTTYTTGTSDVTVFIPETSTTYVWPAQPDPTPKKRSNNEDLNPELLPRDGTFEILVPTYATACSSAARYSSACSCIGVLPTTITVSTTLPASTSSITSTITSTIILAETDSVTQTSSISTSETVATATATSFYLKASGGPVGVNGQYLGDSPKSQYAANQSPDLRPVWGPIADAIQCSIDGTTRQLTCNGLPGTFNGCSYVLWFLGEIEFESYPVLCDLNSITYEITCDAIVSVGGDDVASGNTNIIQSCYEWAYNADGSYDYYWWMSQEGGSCAYLDCQNIQVFAELP